MLHLATFMQILIDKCPKPDQTTASMDDHHGEPHAPDPEALSPPSEIMTSETVYDIGDTAPITARVAQDILQVYKVGGKLSRSLASKIIKRSYKLFKAMPNTTRVTVPPGGQITVVGDIHGQIPDLVSIIETGGVPSATNKYFFNGDFVDRGKLGVECCLLLLAFFLAHPEDFVLNRGNHEDAPINRVYGFEGECIEKYDELTFAMFVELFRYLPLFAVINDLVFVVHGGLFNNRKVKLADLDNIVRSDYTAQPAVPYPECLQGLDSEGQWREYYRQLQRDALWSDPVVEPGLVENKRGSGVFFGPDVTKEFLDSNHLSMLIRSHECVRRGFYLPYSSSSSPVGYDASLPLLCTIFSASNYGNCGNEAAVITLKTYAHPNSVPLPAAAGREGSEGALHYSVRHFKMTEGTSIEKNNQSALAELIIKKKGPLTAAFKAIDVTDSGSVSRAQWAEVMQKVTTMKIQWLRIINTLVPAGSLTPSSVNYREFLGSYSVKRAVEDDASAAQKEAGDKAQLDNLYSQRKTLESIFKYFDTNGDGVSEGML